jgi:hypothetical protein
MESAVTGGAGDSSGAESAPAVPQSYGRACRAGRALAVVGLILITAALIWAIILPAYVVGHPDPHAPPLRLGVQW